MISILYVNDRTACDQRADNDDIFYYLLTQKYKWVYRAR